MTAVDQVAARDLSLTQAIDYFLEQWPAEGPSPETVRTYRWQLRWLVRFALERGKPLLSDLTPELLRAGMTVKMARRADHTPTHKGGEEAARSLAHASMAMTKWLAAQGVSVADLTVVKPPRRPERVQPRLRQQEFQALESVVLHRLVEDDRRSAKALVARDLALIHLLADTGLRASEVCSMTLRSVDFQTGSVVVFRGKGKKGRALSIVDPDEPPGTTLRLLGDWIAARQEVRGTSQHDSLWVSYRGTPLKQAALRMLLARLCEAANIDSNRPPHAFRRANFTEAYLADPDQVDVLSARMGWSAKSHHMVSTYTRGAAVDLARTKPMRSLSARWSRDEQLSPSRAPLIRTNRRQRRPVQNGPSRAELVAQLRNDPSLVRALLEALA